MNEALYPVAVIAVVAVVTWTLRAVPFMIFGNRPLPKMMKYLERVLPPAIMTILVAYCLRSIDVTMSPFGIPELVACCLVVGLQTLRNNMYLSIIAGTACYMILIRIL